MTPEAVDLVEYIRAALGPEQGRRGVLVAWSGGVDSTVLVDLMRRWRVGSGAEIAAVHVDHRLRPSSAADAGFCRRLAHRWGLALEVVDIDVCGAGSAQQNARVQRYAAIARAATKLGLGVVATAHHADDAVETALLNFRRGSSAAGMSTLMREPGAPIPSWPDLELVRPLAGLRKQAISAHAERVGLEWRTDPTNAAGANERSRLRREVLPSLSDEGRLGAPMVATVENLAAEADALEQLAEACLQRAWLQRPDTEAIALDTGPLRSAPEAVARMAVRRAVDRLPAAVGLSQSHLTEIGLAIADSHSTRVAARGATIAVERGMLVAEVARGRGGRDLHEREALAIEVGDGEAGELSWFGSRLRWQRVDAGAQPSQSALTARFDLDAVGPRPVVRGPRAGDRLDARSMHGRKAVGQALAEAGVPRDLRWRWPCVLADRASSEVSWVCGLRRAEPQPAASAGPAIEVTWEPASGSFFEHLLLE
jgi:tRNA(Ile)-lysidine synthase